jgi:putative solute:sodium symporter small subunit
MPRTTLQQWAVNKRFTVALLLVWGMVSFGVPYFATDLNFQWLGAPFSFWMTAQGTLLVYLAIVVCYGWAMNHLDDKLAHNNPASHE